MNAAAAMLVASRVQPMGEGVALARQTIADESAAHKLQHIVEVSQRLKAAAG